MSDYRAIWIEMHDEHGYRGKWEREPDLPGGRCSAQLASTAKTEAESYTKQQGGQLVVHDDGEFLVFGVFVNVTPPEAWTPDFPLSGWQWSEGGSDGFRPEWNPEFAAELLGSYVLVGITVHHRDGKEPVKRQFHGRVVECDAEKGITVSCEGYAAGKTECLPPATNVWQAADPARTYHLRSTGEAVRGVQYLSTWSHTPPGGGSAGGAVRL